MSTSHDRDFVNVGTSAISFGAIDKLKDFICDDVDVPTEDIENSLGGETPRLARGFARGISILDDPAFRVESNKESLLRDLNSYDLRTPLQKTFLKKEKRTNTKRKKKNKISSISRKRNHK